MKAQRFAPLATIVLVAAFSFQLLSAHGDFLSAEYSRKRFGIDDGLPETLAWQLFEDSRGFIWAGTYAGFAVCDGRQFSAWWDKEGINVLAVSETPSGAVCGISFWDYAIVDKSTGEINLSPPQKTYRLVPYMGRKLPPGYAVFENREAGGKAIVCLTDTGHVEMFTHEILSDAEPFRKPYWNRAEKTFYLPTAEGVFVVNEAGAVVDSLAGDDIFVLLPHKNTLWGAGEKGIYRLEGKTMVPVAGREFTYDYYAGINLCANRNDDLIIQAYNAVYRFDGSGIETVFDGQVVYDMIVDRENNLWLATYNGVYNCFGLHFRNYAFPENENIRSVAADETGAVYLASEQGNIYRLANGKREKLPIPSVKEVTFFNGAPAAAGGSVFFPGAYREGDILAHRAGRWAWMGLPAAPYIGALPLGNGNLLAVSLADVTITDIDGKTIRRVSREELGQQPACAVEARDGKIYVGGSAGVSLIDGDTTTMLRSEHQGAYRNLALDAQGKIWAATENKLRSVEGDSLVDEYSFGEAIRSIAFTRRNLLLVATLKGVYVRRPDSGDFLFYGINNGFTGEKPISVKMAEQADGSVWLLTSDEAVCFNPEALLEAIAKPRLYLESAMSSRDNIRWTGFPLEAMAKLNYPNRHVRFRFIGLSYSAAERVRYQFRLAGFQDEWSEPTAEREITFHNLPAGNYMFQLKANGGSGESECAPVSYSFTIRPAFWQTLWFAAIVLVVVTGLIVLLVIYYLGRRNQKKLRILERQKQLNLYKIQSIRLRSIPHFNANVLAGIEYHIMNFSKEEANHYLAMYSDFTNITLRDVDLPSRSVEEEIRYIELYLGLEKMRFGKDFHFAVEIAPGADTRVHIPNMLLHTHCENALKHGLRRKRDEKRLRIRILPLDADRILICIEDNGIGREEAARRQTQGTQQGLYILQRQIELYNQSNQQHIEQRFIDLRDKEGNACGTQVEVVIPVTFIYG